MAKKTKCAEVHSRLWHGWAWKREQDGAYESIEMTHNAPPWRMSSIGKWVKVKFVEVE